jgi:hypothetical protein
MRPPGAEMHRGSSESRTPSFGESPPEQLAGELSAMIVTQSSGESPDARPADGVGRASPGSSSSGGEKLKSLQRGLLNDVPTDSLDLQQLVRTGERTKVWRARWRDTGEQVTVKAIDVGSAELELDLKDDLRREVDSLRDCRHPNVVSFHLSYVDEGRLWVVMAYHHAVSIRELLSSGLAECSIRYVCTAVLSGLAYIHGMGKTHRYVKGANILLDREGAVRLGDFGVAEQLSTLTRNKATIGTPYWMAPEVVLRPRDAPTATAHAKSDVWSLGITAIEMMEILPPHASSLSPVRVLKAIAEGPPPTFSWSKPSELLRSFTTACLARDMAKRPTAEECLQHAFLRPSAAKVQEDAAAAAARSELLARREQILIEQAEAAGDVAADGDVQPAGVLLDESLPLENTGSGNRGDGPTAATPDDFEGLLLEGERPAGTAAARPSGRSSLGSSFGSNQTRGESWVPDVAPLSSPLVARTGQATTSAQLVRPTWQLDADATQCPGCQRRFNLFTLRKHHCRGCGVIFCAGCSRFVVQLDPQVAATLRVPADEPQRTWCAVYLPTPRNLSCPGNLSEARFCRPRNSNVAMRAGWIYPFVCPVVCFYEQLLTLV